MCLPPAASGPDLTISSPIFNGSCFNVPCAPRAVLDAATAAAPARKDLRSINMLPSRLTTPATPMMRPAVSQQ